MARRNITHFLHEGHILIPTDDGRTYICNGCYLSGKGARYRCHPCNFDLHFLCAECPLQIPLLGHRMTLFAWPKRSPHGTSLLWCDGCTQMVEGMFYHMEGDNFDLHPVCLVRQLQQPQAASNATIHERETLNGFLRLIEVGLNLLSILSLFGGGFDVSSLMNAFDV